MIRRRWILLVGWGLCLLPACTRQGLFRPSSRVPAEHVVIIDQSQPPAPPGQPSPEAGPVQRRTEPAQPAEGPLEHTRLAVPELPGESPPPPLATGTGLLLGPTRTESARVPSLPGSTGQTLEPGGLVPIKVNTPPDDPPLVAALRCFLDKRPEDALSRLQNYEKGNQELLLHLLPFLARLTEENIEKADPQELAVLLDQMQSMLSPLQPRAALGIDQMCFCRSIEKYGVYDSLPADHKFRPEELVLVYVELRNFACVHTDKGHETRLASSVEVLDARGDVILRQDFPEQPDRCLTARHDYFNTYRLAIPANVPPGEYVLRIQVTDLAGCTGAKEAPPHRTAVRSLPFRVTHPATGS